MAALDTSSSGAVASNLYSDVVIPEVRMLAKAKSFFQKRGWFGRGDNSPIIVHTDFDHGKKPGVAINVDFTKEVNQAPVSGKTSIVGTAAPIIHYASKISLHHHRLLLRNEGRLDEQQRTNKLLTEFVPQFGRYSANLQDALAIRSMFTGAAAVSNEDAAWTEIAAWISGNNYGTDNVVVFGGAATGWANIDGTCDFDVDTAFSLGFALDQQGRDPIVVDGVEIKGVCMVSPGQAFTLKRDPRWERMQLLLPQSANNPFFTGAIDRCTLDGIAFFEQKCSRKALGAFVDGNGLSRASMLYHEMSDSYDKVEAICLSAQTLVQLPHTDMEINQYEIDEGGEFPGEIFHTTMGYGKLQTNDGDSTTADLIDVGVTYVATSAPTPRANRGVS